MCQWNGEQFLESHPSDDGWANYTSGAAPREITIDFTMIQFYIAFTSVDSLKEKDVFLVSGRHWQHDGNGSLGTQRHECWYMIRQLNNFRKSRKSETPRVRSDHSCCGSSRISSAV